MQRNPNILLNIDPSLQLRSTLLAALLGSEECVSNRQISLYFPLLFVGVFVIENKVELKSINTVAPWTLFAREGLCQ